MISKDLLCFFSNSAKLFTLYTKLIMIVATQFIVRYTFQMVQTYSPFTLN